MTNAADHGDPILYDWTRHLAAEARRDAEPGRETMAEALVLEREVERRTELIRLHPEWMEIWGVDLSPDVVDAQTLRREPWMPAWRNLRWTLDAVARRFVRKGWQWRFTDTVGGRRPFIVMERFDPWEGGERFRIEGIHQTANPGIYAVRLAGGGKRFATGATVADLYHLYGEEVSRETLDRLTFEGRPARDLA